ncbi:MAG: hypothetical protein M3Q31_10525 [Actinomycetota bacterium]|nr:hypothetical protein [Actinomycetota bacterium]
MTVTAEGTRSATVPSAEELTRITLGVGEGCGPVEELGAILGHVEEHELTDAQCWQLTVVAKEAHACADLLHGYASELEEQIGRLTLTAA